MSTFFIYVKTPRDASGLQSSNLVQVSRLPCVGERMQLPSSLHYFTVADVIHYAARPEFDQSV